MCLVPLLLIGGAVQAHETRPAVADLTLSPDTATLSITMPLEAPLAGIDLDGLDDTNDAPRAADYDALRALAPEALARRARAALPDLAPLITLRGAAGDWRLVSLDVPETGNIDLPRDSVLTLETALAPGTSEVVFSWDRSLGPIILRQGGAAADEDGYAVFLSGGDASDPIPLDGAVAASTGETFARYIVVGFEHIIPKGIDHILFVLGLFFFSTRLRPLLLQVSAFTVAHTVTLALATFGIVNLPGSIVEPLIALSIAYVAFENILSKRMSPWRPVLVFGFGLLHGLGFASVLGEVGLAPGLAAVGLIAFNIGVELGQLAVIFTAFLLVGFWFGAKPWYRARIAIPASVVIGLVGLYWVVERVGLVPQAG